MGNTVKSLKELIAEAEALETKIKALKKAEKIREASSEKIEKTNRLLVDLKNVNLPCVSELRNSLEVITIFSSKLCKRENCQFVDTCKTIVDLNKKRTGRTGTTGKVKLAINKLKKTFSKGVLAITINGTEVSQIKTGKEWSEYKKNLKTQFPKDEALSVGLSLGQYQGLQHRNTMEKIIKF